MKRNSIYTLIVILAVAGAISYGIIWYRKKKENTPDDATAAAATTPETKPAVNTANTPGTGYGLPKLNSYAWWITAVGRAKFPLGMNSKGVEVLKVQEVLNALSVTKGLGKITEDGIWGNNTESRFKTLFPGFSLVTQYMFINDFDKNSEII